MLFYLMSHGQQLPQAEMNPRFPLFNTSDEMKHIAML